MMDDLEFLRGVFEDNKQWVGIGVITQVGLSLDKGIFRAQVKLLGDDREVVCFTGFPDPYDVTIPQVTDLVLVGFADGHPDQAYILVRFHNSSQTIPTFAQSGHSVKYARPGKKLYLGSDTKVGIGHSGNEQTSPLVLGDVMKNCISGIINAFLNATAIGECAGMPVFLDPTLRGTLSGLIGTYVTTAGTNIVSQIAFTERGP